MDEAFVKTFKRDYVWSADLFSAVAVMGQLEACTVTLDILELSQDHRLGPFFPECPFDVVPEILPDHRTVVALKRDKTIIGFLFVLFPFHAGNTDFFAVFHQSPNALKMLRTHIFRDHSPVGISAVSTHAILSNKIQFERG
jgi:hypothetical protein